MINDKRELHAFCVGIFLICAAILIFEIALIRIFSVTIWYHFAFMVISIAMFGFGSSGAFLAVFRKLLTRDSSKFASTAAILCALSLMASLALICRLKLDPFQIINNPKNLLNLAVYYVVFSVPFFLGGLCIAFLFSKLPEYAGKLYFFNLFGAGCGCYLAILLIPLFSSAGAVIFSSLLVSVAALFFRQNHSRKFIGIVSAIMILQAALLFSAKDIFDFKIADSKAFSQAKEQLKIKPDFTRWNVFSRLDVLKDTGMFYAPGLSDKYPLKKLPEQAFIYIDADAIATVTANKKGGENELLFKYIPSSLAYHLKANPKVCIIGAGGGFDVLTALSVSRPKHIFAVEINPDISKIVNENFGEFSGDIFKRPGVTLVNAEGRSFIRNCRDTEFDIIQLSLVDTWAAASSGAYGLAENYLYTQEAFVDYINHLSDTGILTVTRWLLVPPKESLRLASLAFSSLEKLGVANPENNIVFIYSKRVAVLLLKKTPFLVEEIKTIEQLCADYGWGVLYAPHAGGKNIFYKFINYKDKQYFYDKYPFNIEPTTDDQPFYFHYYSWKNMNISKIWRIFSIDRNNISYLILLFLLIQALFLSLVFIAGPLILFKGAEHKTVLARRSLLFYFACLGMGFMFVEVVLIQKFILFLGHPVYSLSVVLSSLLIFAGLGSLFSAKADIDVSYRRVKIVLFLLIVLLFVYVPLLPRLSYVFLGQHILKKFVISILLIAPAGFLMGMPFPLGIRLAGRIESRLIPWLWAVNGCFSVISSILSIIVAMSFGFSNVLKLAAVFYMVAVMSINRVK
ncbi:MAG: hypothetical protein KKB82_04570 [Candidatus Omnitrophica bacterium]|nr:hypothetical protein [Candidatus Omnitrophota bacterium]